MATTQQAKQRLYLTADKKQLVAEGDKRAATLYAAEGDFIPNTAAERFGLVDGRLKPAKVAPPKPPAPAKPKKPAKPKAGAKEAAPAPNKEQAPGETKQPAELAAPAAPAALA